MKKEIILMVIFSIIFGFIIAFPNNYNLSVFIVSFPIIFINFLSKKLASKWFFVDIRHEIWKFQRFGFYKKSYFKKPIPIGIIFPFFITIASLGFIKPLTFFEFKSKPSKLRVLKSRNRVRKSEINESDLAFISAIGFYSLILLAFLGYLINYPELTKYSIYFGIWNLLPFGKLDGIKLFFGSFFNWILLAIIYLISLIMVLI